MNDDRKIRILSKEELFLKKLKTGIWDLGIIPNDRLIRKLFLSMIRCEPYSFLSSTSNAYHFRVEREFIYQEERRDKLVYLHWYPGDMLCVDKEFRFWL